MTDITKTKKHKDITAPNQPEQSDTNSFDIQDKNNKPKHSFKAKKATVE